MNIKEGLRFLPGIVAGLLGVGLLHLGFELLNPPVGDVMDLLGGIVQIGLGAGLIGMGSVFIVKAS